MAKRALGTNAKRLGTLLEDIDIAMLGTVGADGYLVSRPVSTRAARFDGTRLWFFIEADSPKVGEIRRHPKVNLAYASDRRNTYVSIAGEARVLHDQARIDALWSDAMKAYFPRGRRDPNLALLEVTVHSAEYWDGPGTLLGKLLTFVVARITRREEVMGENRLLELDGDRVVARLPPSHARARKGAREAARRAPVAARRAAHKPAARKPAGTAPARKASAAAKSPARKTAGKATVRKARKATARKTATR